MEDDYLLKQLRREQAVIYAMHHRPWWRVGILLRRPWRARHPRYSPFLQWVYDWLFVHHDCADPLV